MSTSTAAAPPATSGAEGPESAVGVDATGVVSGLAFDGVGEGAVVRGAALGDALGDALLLAFAPEVTDGEGEGVLDFPAVPSAFLAAGNTTSEHE